MRATNFTSSGVAPDGQARRSLMWPNLELETKPRGIIDAALSWDVVGETVSGAIVPEVFRVS